MTITPETIAELRGLLEITSPLPWEWTEDLTALPFRAYYQLRVATSDATLITAAVNALPALLDAAERLAEVTAERDALAASVARVRELHAPRPYADADLRTVSPSLPAEVCGSCWMHSDSAVPYPCPTIRALDGSES